mmetsp:Transcript_21254/g.33056  ORF Transcript_21254/g.33056 Transcript_21254/m.33056 type:complete len:240 (-) Transcript_21254:55-774(-)
MARNGAQGIDDMNASSSPSSSQPQHSHHARHSQQPHPPYPQQQPQNPQTQYTQPQSLPQTQPQPQQPQQPQQRQQQRQRQRQQQSNQPPPQSQPHAKKRKIDTSHPSSTTNPSSLVASSKYTPDSGIPKITNFEDEELKALYSAFTEEQEERFKYYRRSSLPRGRIKRKMEGIIQDSVSDEMVVVMAGVAKMHLGELVEMGKEVQCQWGDTGSLAPCHIKEAYRRLQQSKKMMSGGYLA